MFSNGNGPVAILVRVITAVAAVGIGLKGMNIDLEAILHLQKAAYALRVIVGLCGAYSLLAFVLSCCNDCGSCKVNEN